MNKMIDTSKKMVHNPFLLWTMIVICAVISILFVKHNYSLYERPIATIEEVTLVDTEEMTDMYDNEDQQFTQHVKAEIKNGAYKGQFIQMENVYSTSGAYDQQYHQGNDVFISIAKNKAADGTLTGDITDVKRDTQMLTLVWIFILVLWMVGKWQGFFASVSLAINMLLLSFALDMYVYQEVNLLWICAITVVLFTVLSLLLVNGFNEKTYAAIIATLLGTFLSLLITYVVMWATKEEGLYYEEMQFLTRPYQLVFLAGLFIGSLGAVMDVAISISSALFELYRKNKAITVSALKKSGMDIGKDIMGTMTNILFFAYVSGSIPTLILYMKNYSPLGFTLSINLSLELARALAGGIGIVITIPIGLYTTIFFINRRRAKS